jgi:putative ABC transport system ATP-binding protein
MATTEPLLELRDVRKTYRSPAGDFDALAGIDLSAHRGEFVAIAGRSGSGKSTLLNVLAGIDRPSTGEIVVEGRSLGTLGESELAGWRGQSVGIVFQFFQLLPTLTAAENVMLPMDFARKWDSRERRERAIALLGRLGLADHADKLPAALSGGQQQRVAVARALANEPPLVLADEPTGNLDSQSSRELLDLLTSLASEGRTVMMATHEPTAMEHASRVVTLADGRIVDGDA